MDNNKPIYVSEDGNSFLYKRHSFKRLKFNKNFNKLKLFKIAIILSFILIIVLLLIFLKCAYPTFKSSCELAAASKGNKIISSEVKNIIKKYSYDDLVSIEKDVNGRITLINIDSLKINNITNEIIYNIQLKFDDMPRIKVPINIGTISGISYLSNFEPSLEAYLESGGKINSMVNTKFEAVGINQTEHKIFIDLNSDISILTPFGTFSKEINENVLLVEAIIVGEVPNTFYEINGLDSIKDTYNFKLN